MKNGIESMLMHYVSNRLLLPQATDNYLLQIEEVKTVEQVLDQEEEIAIQEFAKFEAKLKERKGSDAIASTVGKGSLDTAEA